MFYVYKVLFFILFFSFFLPIPYRLKGELLDTGQTKLHTTNYWRELPFVLSIYLRYFYLCPFFPDYFHSRCHLCILTYARTHSNTHTYMYMRHIKAFSPNFVSFHSLVSVKQSTGRGGTYFTVTNGTRATSGIVCVIAFTAVDTLVVLSKDGQYSSTI